jgi:hypothetical protein
VQVRLERILDKLTALQQPTIFGATEHQGRLGPRLPEPTSDDFERRHGIILPIGYRAFLTQVGHGAPGRYGGTGPFYGLLPLECWDEALVGDTRDGVLSVAFPFTPGRDYTAGNWLDEDGELFPGAIALARLGCGDMAVLVAAGEGRGRVAYTFWATQAPVYTEDPDFLAWYERWLDAALAGDSPWF